MSPSWDAKQYQQRHSYVFQYGQAVLDLLAPQKGERILDLGCGSGQLTAAIADAGASVIGMDSSPEMLAEARAHYPAIDFRLGNAADFALESPVDAVFSNAVLHWVKDAAGAARCIARALKPGGRFVAEFGGHGNIQSIVDALHSVLGPVETPWYYPSIGEYATLLEQHALETREAWLIDRPTPVEGEDGMEDWLAVFARDFAPREVLRTVAEKLRSTNYKDGVWTIDYRRLRIVAHKTALSTPPCYARSMSFSQSFFAERFGITEHDLESYLSEALSAGGDYADVYFEYLATSSIGIDEQIVKSATEGVSMGAGVRVIAGERTGYAYSDDLSPAKIRKAAHTAALIAKGPASVMKTGFEETQQHNLYPMLHAPNEMGLEERVALVKRADIAARAYDSRVFQVQATYADSLRNVLVATSEGKLSFDRQPMARMSVMVLARQPDGPPQHGYAGGGGRVTLDFFLNEKTPEDFAREAARQAIVQLDAIDAPAGEMPVVLGAGWPGILLHEAVGHGLEADFNRKGTSAFSGRIGQQVASPLCTVIDDGTIGSRRGSLNVDDEGMPTQKNVLIENGVLRGYLQDKLSSRLMKTASSGSGRRESYQHIPMPRMTNTYMLAGDSDPADIVRSVKKGLYCTTFSGGQVDITSGNFVFSATESYLIEDGKITRPVRGASLIGNGPEALKYVSMVGNDLKLDEGIGTCGKEGQSVPVGVGIPTVKIDKMTVGGTAA